MSLFDKIKHAIFGDKGPLGGQFSGKAAAPAAAPRPAPAAPAAQPAKPAAAPAPTAAPAAPAPVDVEAVLSQRAAAKGAEQNIALHKAVMKKLAENGGKVPAALQD